MLIEWFVKHQLIDYIDTLWILMIPLYILYVYSCSLHVGGCCFLPNPNLQVFLRQKTLEVNYGMTLTPPMCDAMLLQNLRSLSSVYLEGCFALFKHLMVEIRRYMQEKKAWKNVNCFFSWRNLLQRKVGRWDFCLKGIWFFFQFWLWR